MSDSSVTFRKLLPLIGIGVVLQFGPVALWKQVNVTASPSDASGSTVLKATTVAVQPDRTPPSAAQKIQSNSDEPYAFVSALIDSIGWARTGVERTWQPSDSESAAGMITSIMTGLRLSDMDLRRAAAAVAPFVSSADKPIRIAAEGAQLAYQQHIDLNNQAVVFLRGPTGKKASAGAMAEFFASHTAERTESWRLLSMVVAPATTHALVDPTFDANKKLTGRLRVTAEERKKLLAALESTYGPGVKAGMKAGMNHVDGAGALIYTFLANEKWKSKDAP